MLTVELVAAHRSAPEAQPPAVAIDGLFARFWQAPSPAAAAALTSEIAASGVTFDDAFARLKHGRSFSRTAPTGVVHRSHTVNGGELFYVLNVPESYDPTRRYQVRFQLHGGVTNRDDNKPVGPDTIGMLAGVEQIYVIPYAWNQAPWWSSIQVENLRAILDELKRTYNVDENRVVVSGVSDGGTGVYYLAMRDTTPYASFLPLNGFILVLANEELGVDTDLHPNNLRNKPFFVVNGGLDPLYPISAVEPFIQHMKSGGVDLVYEPQEYAAHDLRWWPRVKDTFESFVQKHPRRPLPDALTLETADGEAFQRRAHWLIIDKIGKQPGDAADLADLNLFSPGPKKEFGVQALGTRVVRVTPGSNAAAIGLMAADYIVRFNDQTVPVDTDIDDLLDTVEPGSNVQFLVARRNLPVELKGKFEPHEVTAPVAPVFTRSQPWGRADLVREGNTIRVTSRGVAAFTLLLSPDQFDFGQPVKVVANGRTVFDGRVEKDLATLLKWAAADNDRTMLFGAEIHVDLTR